MEISDITGIGKLAEVFVNAIGKAFGFILRPLQIKRVASAKVEAFEQANKALGGSANIHTDGDDIELSTPSLQEQSLIEQKRDNNLQSIVEKVIEELSHYPDDTEVSFDEDWTSYWMECSRHCYDEEIQLIWAKIMAGKFTKNGNYSKRSLDIMKTLSKEEADIFRKVCSCIFWIDPMGVLVNYTSNKEIFGVSIRDVMTLDDIGLVNDSSKSFTLANGELTFEREGFTYIVHAPKGSSRSIYIVSLTASGQELFSLVQERKQFTDDQLKVIFQIGKGEYITVHKDVPNTNKYLTKPIRTIS